LRLDSEVGVTKGTSISIKGKLGKEYTTSRGKKARSINNCEFEVIGNVQESAPTAQSSESEKANVYVNPKDNYWEKKFDWEVKRDKKVQYLIVRQCAVKCATELNIAKILSKKPDALFDCADAIVDWIYKKELTSEDITKEFGGTKEERIDKAREVVGETEFKPMSPAQQKIIFGYEDKERWDKGIIESRYITKEEIRHIGDPKKLSIEKASKCISWWWGENEEEGERKKRERLHPRNEDGTLVGDLTKGDETSLTKDVLVDDINAWRRENFLISDAKFKKELGYSGKLETLSEEDLLKIKKLTKNYHPKSWDK
jgi:hypothetical protein